MVAPDPDAGVAAPPLGGDAEARAGVNDGSLERAHQRYDLAKALEFANRIDDELSRPVVGDVAAALDRDEVDAAARELSGEKSTFSRLAWRPNVTTGVCSTTIHVSGSLPFANGRVQPMLQLPHLSIRSHPEIEQTRVRSASRAPTGVFGLGLMM